MEGETFSMAEYKREHDKNMANVMPDHWPGHIRLMSGKQKEFAERLTERLVERGHTEKQSRAAAVRKARAEF